MNICLDLYLFEWLFPQHHSQCLTRDFLLADYTVDNREKAPWQHPRVPNRGNLQSKKHLPLTQAGKIMSGYTSKEMTLTNHLLYLMQMEIYQLGGSLLLPTQPVDLRILKMDLQKNRRQKISLICLVTSRSGLLSFLLMTLSKTVPL